MHENRIVGGLVIKHTGPKGFGVFTARAYRRGEMLFLVDGVRIKDTDRRLTHRGIQIGANTFLEPRRYSAAWFLNHSCAPNAYVDMDRIIARRPIKNGEEITADYSLFTNYPSWDMRCHCHAKGCRGLIVPFCRLPSRPKKFVSAYLC